VRKQQADGDAIIWKSGKNFLHVIKRKFTAFHQHQDSGRGHGFGYRSQLKLRTQFQAVAMQVIAQPMAFS